MAYLKRNEIIADLDGFNARGFTSEHIAVFLEPFVTKPIAETVQFIKMLFRILSVRVPNAAFVVPPLPFAGIGVVVSENRSVYSHSITKLL
jgi:hypothetical protein